ncbi:cytochrome c oxidase assembly protein COX11, mitochondrial [Exaiptasia diaphana]|uniref:Cytochrome c oxidase assembly protein COX11, mitochondrial n=1 Tax=Exaiptasia diaphana TaxID=2652724 RepID=A0A913X9V6_EXADI|nr:cytochrome c oxidase assembly protein COX11, mitochondrial [Exaiptasia diaphana]KXJ20600.1 Cytochrome c oxidase assembly protein COX11, mitochondrial [Exaiptasia diaphana]
MYITSARLLYLKFYSSTLVRTSFSAWKSFPCMPQQLVKRFVTFGYSRQQTSIVNKDCTSLRFFLRRTYRGFANKTNVHSDFNRNKTTVLYVGALAVTVLGFSYAAVPLYRLYCQASGLGGTVKQADIGEKIESMERQEDRILKIKFNADTSSSMQWHFKPQQTEVKVAPGETSLAFYTATNPTDQPITGVSTYNVVPFEAGQYFNKIQCFCFEEQRLNPHEQVDMPVFFFIDPEFTEDPAMAKVDTIILSYTFFEAKEAENMGL